MPSPSSRYAVFAFASRVALLTSLLLAFAPLAARAQSLGAGPGSYPRDPQETADQPPALRQAWGEIARLTSERKFEEALERVTALRKELGVAENHRDYTRALIRETHLRIAVSGEEAALGQLRGTPWPKAVAWRLVVALFYGEQLKTYRERFSNEIRMRERLASGGDLWTWTNDEICGEANRALAEVWSKREALGAEPLEPLKEYLGQSSYPAEIRGTLRDAMVYLFAAQLADPRCHQPERPRPLDSAHAVEALLRGSPQPTSRVKLDDPALDPLVRMGALLDEHEAWHQRAGRRQAALEARLEKLRLLHGRLTRPEHQALIRAHLERLLEDAKSLAWWSMGMAQLAEFHRESKLPDGGPRPDANQRAHATATACEKAGQPSSLGVRRCANLARTLEAPDYQLESMRNDAPGQRSLVVTHRNVTKLHFRAWRLESPDKAPGSPLRALEAPHVEFKALLDRSPDHTWTSELPATPDFAQHRTYISPPMTRRGVWAVVASIREDFDPRINLLRGVAFVLTDLVIVQRNDEGGPSDVLILSSSTGKPVPGVDVELYRQQSELVAEAKTDAGGTARFQVAAGAAHELLAHKGDDWAFLWPWRGPREGFPSRGYQRPDSRLPSNEAPAPVTALLFTDRRLYRPGQKVLWKAVAYRKELEPGVQQTLPDTSLEVILSDEQRQEVSRVAVRTNGFGSASGEFSLPTDRPLGSWSLSTSLGGNAPIRVEEHRHLVLQASLRGVDAPLQFGREARIRGEARYGANLPASGGQVKWSVRRTVAPTPDARQVSSDWRHEEVATGTSPIAEDGRFTVAFTPQPLDGAEKLPHHFSVRAEITAGSGGLRSDTATFTVNAPAVEASIRSSKGFFSSTQAPELEVLRREVQGRGAPGEGRWRLFVLEQPAKVLLPADHPLPAKPEAEGAYRTPGDLLQPRIHRGSTFEPLGALEDWTDGKLTAEGALAHDRWGTGRLTLPKLAPGVYRLRYETTDEQGRRATAAHVLIVAGTALSLKVPLLLLPEEESIGPGEAARFLAHSALPGQSMLLEVRRDGQPILEKWLPAAPSPSIVELPRDASGAGHYTARLTAVRDYQLMTQTKHVEVRAAPARLKLELSTFRDRIHPGDKETWRLTVTDSRGTPLPKGEVEVTASLCDADLATSPIHDWRAMRVLPRPEVGARSGGAFETLVANTGQEGTPFASGRDIALIPASPNLSASRTTFPSAPGYRGTRPRPTPLRAPGGYGPPARPPPVRPAEGGPPPKFAEGPEVPLIPQGPLDTVLWQPHLTPGADGTATVEFTVPDSAREWRLWAFALARDFRFALEQETVTATKALMVRPVLPRMLRAGDRTELKLEVSNTSERPLEGQVRLDLLDPATNANLLAHFGLKGPATRPFSVPSGNSATLTFVLDVPAEIRAVAVKATATCADFSDGEVQVLPVLPRQVPAAHAAP